MRFFVRSVTTSLIVLLVAFAGACASGTSSSPPDTDSPDAQQEGTDDVNLDEIERLRALGYVNVAPALPPDAQVGVVQHDPDRAAPGVNLFTSAKFCSAQLIGMDGRVHRTWSHEPCFRWGNVVLTDSGDLLTGGRLPHGGTPDAAMEARYLMRQDWNGDVLWNRKMPVHHDIDVTPDGRLLTLTYRFRVIPEIDPEVPVRDNAIALLDSEGELLEEVSLWDVLQSAPDLYTLQEGRSRTFEGGNEVDLFHANSVEWMREAELVGKHSIYRKNGVLFCVRNQDTLGIVDWETKELVWAWGQGELMSPHDATLLPNGNILAFDNGLGRKWSRVVEIDPIRREIVWQYAAPDAESFYSGARGANQRLANGNTLITESDDGRIFEVTPDGEIVWEFINPNMTEKREPSVVVRMRRFENVTYEELARRIEAGEGLPAVVD